ncbi:MAG: PTS sugar transporter subunit IIA [Deltaproteobacteria bacterium]|nr:PTS sugar transporter subunit IIA [Deltaproteobacteria bacterium]
MIWEQIDKDLINVEVNATDQNGVLEVMGRLLIDKGYAKDSYVKALQKRESENPTGIDMSGFGIAIPHTDISHVLKDAIGIGILRKPVKFMAMGTDDEYVEVSLVFVLSITDPKAHLDHIQGILTVLQDKSVLEAIRNSKTPEEIITIIKNKENPS